MTLLSQYNSSYFASDEPDNTVTFLQMRAAVWFNKYVENNYLYKLKRSWECYSGAYYQDGHKISYGGEQGELVNLPVNHYRNIARNILNMITSNRPAFQPRATNLDSKSESQVHLASGLLDYYMREKKLERYLKKAVEYAIVLGSGYVKVEWNATTGTIYDYIEPEHPIDENGNKVEPYPVYEGDVHFLNLSPFDVIFDTSKETYEEQNWVLVRYFRNKYDLAAKYPEFKEQILALKTKTDIDSRRFFIQPFDETQDVPVYEFMHRKTEALPNGRCLIYLDKDIILSDTQLPYRDIPVYRITPADFIGTPFGYTDMFDLIPIQMAVNSLYSTIMTNQNAFGVQNILNPRGNDVRLMQVEGGLNFIEYNQQFGKPESLNLTQTPQEIFAFVQMLERTMETISGVSSVVRGSLPTEKFSGNALALLQSQALQFMSGLQQSYIQLIEDTGTGLINMLQDFAAVPRIAAISGINNQTKIVEFTGADLGNVNRIIVDVGNALAQCLEKDTPVLMYDGSINLVQDIKIGDKLMGPDSKPRTVKNVNSGKETMYTIKSRDKNRNISYGCNESHILTLKYCSDDYRYNAKKGDVLDISVKEYLKLSKRQRRVLQGFTTGVEFDTKEVLIPSYILGSWLGDGHSASTSITTMDAEILNEWQDCAKKFNLSIRKDTNKNCGKASIYFITSGKQNGSNFRNPLMNELRRLNLIKNKHIPDLYLKNSRKERLELLAGLLDTDGSLIDETFIFTQKNDVLSKQVIFLAKSLGFKVTHRRDIFIGAKSNKLTHINKINIGGNTSEIPTRLPRKQAAETTKQKDWLNYGIEVEASKEDTYYGFTLLEEPHFLLGDFTVTHNTTAGKVAMAEQLLQMKLIDSPEKYIEVMNTGKLEALTSGQQSELLLIRSENEHLMKADMQIAAVATDRHALHIREHRTVLADPKLRMSDPQLVARVSAHIQEHIHLLQTTDPNILALIGEQPLAPPQGSPLAPQNAMAQQPPQGSLNAEMPKQMQNKESSGLGMGPQGLVLPGESPKQLLSQPAKPAQPPKNARPGALPVESGV